MRPLQVKHLTGGIMERGCGVEQGTRQLNQFNNRLVFFPLTHTVH
jgi:hypothetical protein